MKPFSRLSICSALFLSVSAPVLFATNSALAQGIDLILETKIPVPALRPDRVTTGSVASIPATSQIVSSKGIDTVTARSGNLETGLKALAKGDVQEALGIRAGMPAGSLDRKILAWIIAVSGKDGIQSGTIADIAGDLSDWPGQPAMRQNAELALIKEGISGSRMIALFNGKKPETPEGAIALASAYLDAGNRTLAHQVIAPIWREQTLDEKLEAKILDRFGGVLNRQDHRQRMHRLFYRDRIEAANRLAARSEQFSLAKARTAAIRNTSNARTLINSVAAPSQTDTAYLFTRIEHARRTENWKLAKELLLSAATSQNDQVDPDEWWVERRIVSRKLVELGEYKTAYRIAAGHSAKSASDRIEAEFHAGWYALRFLKNPATARRHFGRLLSIATRPISISRGHYWMARASSGSTAEAHYRKAAQHKGTFYGQLAAHELGIRDLQIRKPSVSGNDRARFADRELVRVIRRLEETGNGGWANGFYLHLARELDSPGELALLAARAEREGNYQLSLQIGKIANGRGLNVDTLAWPKGAIPSNAKIGNDNLALAYAIARQESAFNKAAVSGANARGLMQLLPGTAKAVARKGGYTYSKARLTSDAAYNATLGTAYLNTQMREFDNSYILTFIAYNAGPRRVSQWIERFGDPRGKSLYDVIDWVEMIPFSETRHYVQRVLENYQVYKARIAGENLSIARDLTKGR